MCVEAIMNQKFDDFLRHGVFCVHMSGLVRDYFNQVWFAITTLFQTMRDSFAIAELASCR